MAGWAKLKRGARNRWRRLSRSRAPGGLILLYHRVDSVPSDPLGLRVQPTNFASHLEAIRRLGRPVPLEELVRAAASGDDTRGWIALSFDDGYATVLSDALPLLEERDVPATVFVATGAPGRLFWWDRLAASRETGDRRQLRNDIDRRSRGAVSPYGSHDLEEEDHEPLRSLTVGELVALSSSSLIDVGAHTSDHLRLAGRSEAEQRLQIEPSRDFLARTLGRAPAGFSYPFGLREDFDHASVALARRGFAYAVTNEVGRVSSRADRHRLPRLWCDDLDGREFAAFLKSWL